jgi:MFS family permease
VLFQLADASMLPLVAENLGTGKAETTSLMTSGLIAAPQLIVVLLAPWVGYLSETWGRKPLLLAGFAIEAARGVLLAFFSSYLLLFSAQIFDGATSAIVGVLTLVIVTDLTTGTGRFNLTRGSVTLFSSIAASISTSASGFIFDKLGHPTTFIILAVIAVAAATFAGYFLPETKPTEYLD